MYVQKSAFSPFLLLYAFTPRMKQRPILPRHADDLCFERLLFFRSAMAVVAVEREPSSEGRACVFKH